MINPSWRRFLTRKRFEAVFESKKRGFFTGIESGRRKIINHDFVQGQQASSWTANLWRVDFPVPVQRTTTLYRDREIHPCQRFATSTTRQASSWTANLWHSSGFPCPLQSHDRFLYSHLTPRGTHGDCPREGPGVKSRMCPPYPQRDRKRRLNGVSESPYKKGGPVSVFGRAR